MYYDDSEQRIQREIDNGDKPAISLVGFPDEETDAFTVTWFWRALRTGDGLDIADRFIALWISFNSIIRKGREKWNDSDLIMQFYRDDYWKRILKESKREGFAKYLSELKSLCPVENSKDGTQVSITAGDLDDIIKVIYQVRSNLFHGRKDPSAIDSRDVKLIRCSYALLLLMIIRHLQDRRLLRVGRDFSVDELFDGYDILSSE